MTLWRYVAVPSQGAHRSSVRRGELAGESAMEVRSSLRRIGLQAIDVKPLRSAKLTSFSLSGIPAIARHLRARRKFLRAELYDSLATMLNAGLPLLEAVETIMHARSADSDEPTDASRIQRFIDRTGIGSLARRMSSGGFPGGEMREALRSGHSLAEAMADQPLWFDQSEIAMVRAGQHGGTLARVLRVLADRQQRSNQLTSKLAGALAYPIAVAVIGIGVVVFLSSKTLPELVTILTDAGIDPPGLTSAVMAVGQTIASWWHVILLGLMILIGSASVGSELLRRRGGDHQRTSGDRRLSGSRFQGRRFRGCAFRGPRVMRRLAVGRFAMELSELLRTGVPVIDSLRVLAPTMTSRRLRTLILTAADQVEQGDELAISLHDRHWFDAEFARLVEVGQTAGELDELLERLGERYLREAERLIDRLTTLLEPCVILALAALVGLVVMAAVLPLLRIQEIL